MQTLVPLGFDAFLFVSIMKTEIINFKNAVIYAVVDEDGIIWVAVKTIADAIGLHADSAVRGIKNTEF